MDELPDVLTRLSVTTSVAIVIAGRRGSVQWCNPAFLELTGLEREEIAGLQLVDVLCGRPTNRNTRQALDLAIEIGTALTLTILNRRADGTRFRLHADVTPIRDELGHLTHFAVLAHEIRSGAQEVLHEEAVVIDLYRTLFSLAEITEPEAEVRRRVLAL